MFLGWGLYIEIFSVFQNFDFFGFDFSFFRKFHPPQYCRYPRESKFEKSQNTKNVHRMGVLSWDFFSFSKFWLFRFWIFVFSKFDPPQYCRYPREAKFEKSHNTKNVPRVGVLSRDFYRFPKFWLFWFQSDCSIFKNTVYLKSLTGKFGGGCGGRSPPIQSLTSIKTLFQFWFFFLKKWPPPPLGVKNRKSSNL